MVYNKGMSRGKNSKQNPLLNEQARKRTSAGPGGGRLGRSDFLAVEALKFQPSPKLWAQQEAADITCEHFTDPAAKLEKAAHFWLEFNKPADEYFETGDAAIRHLVFHWPFLAKEHRDAIRQTKAGDRRPYLRDDKGCFGSPWGSNSSLIWQDVVLNAFMFGPKGEQVAAELILPALDKHLQLVNKYNPPDKARIGANSLVELKDILLRLQNKGVMEYKDIVTLRHRLHYRHYQSTGRKVQWGAELTALWDNAAQEVLQEAIGYQNKQETPAGLQLLVAFNQQVGAPFKSVVCDALMDPAWTKSL
jgi:hypothetical protein